MGDQPKAIAELSEGHRGRRALPDAARRDRHRQDGDDGLDHRAGPAADAADRAQQDAGRPALQRAARVLPRQRGRVLRLLLRLLPARGVRPAGRPLHREGLLAERRHRPAAPRGDRRAALAPRRDHRRLRLGIYGLGSPEEYEKRVVLLEPGRGTRPRPRPAQADRHPVRRATTLSSAAASSASRATWSRCSRRTWNRPTASRSSATRSSRSRTSTRSPARSTRKLDHLALFPATQYVTSKPTIDARLRRDPARARGAGQALRVGGQDARGAPHPAAHRVRPRDDAGARLLQRDRELLAAPRRPPAGLGAAHAARLLPVGLRRLRGRVAPDRAAARRHVRGRPLAQGDAGRLRLPAALGARQPAAPLRRVPREGAAARVRLGDAGPIRAAPLDAASPSSSIRPTGIVDPEVELRADEEPDRRPPERDPPPRGGRRARCSSRR